MESHVEMSCYLSPGQLHAQKVRTLNDDLRCRHRGGKLYITRGITALGVGKLPLIVDAVAAFDAFSPDNDPYDEHDFGSVTIGTEKVFWKIDYYDRSMEYGSPNPADPEVTTRVMTILLASEY